MKNKQLIGIGWMVSHCFLISVMSVMVRNLSHEFNIMQIVFVQNISAFLLLVPVVVTSNRYKKLKTEKIRLHIIRATLGFIAMTMYCYAFTVMPLTQARAIALTGPLVSSLFAIVFLKEKMGWHRTTALVIGFLGALVILRPGTANFTYVSVMVTGSVFMWSIIDIIIKNLGKTESNPTQLFYLMGIMVLLSFPPAVYFWNPNASYTGYATLFLLGAIFLINCYAVFNAFKNADITAIMPFDFSGMVFTTIIAYLVFGEVIDIWTAVGSVVIVISSVYIVRREAAAHKKTHAEVQKLEI